MTLIETSQLPSIQAKLSGYIAKELAHLRSNADYTIAIASLRLEDVYRMMAVVSFLRDADTLGFHQNMYLAAAVRRRFLQCVDRGMKADKSFLYATYDKAIYESLCAGEVKLIDFLARNRHTLDADERFDNPYYFYFAHALRLFAIRKKDDAAGMIAEFDEFRDGALEGHSLIAHGIIDGDRKMFGKGLRLAITERKAQIKKDDNVFVGEQSLSVECLALARLGRMYQLRAGFSDALIPDELQEWREVDFPNAESVLPSIPDSFIELPEDESEVQE